MAKQMDPICGMPVEEGSAAGTSEYEGQTYHFCSHGCLEKFNEDPVVTRGVRPRNMP